MHRDSPRARGDCRERHEVIRRQTKLVPSVLDLGDVESGAAFGAVAVDEPGNGTVHPGPAGPIAPVAPVAPVASVAPVAPVGPGGPCGPTSPSAARSSWVSFASHAARTNADPLALGGAEDYCRAGVRSGGAWSRARNETRSAPVSCASARRWGAPRDGDGYRRRRTGATRRERRRPPGARPTSCPPSPRAARLRGSPGANASRRARPAAGLRAGRRSRPWRRRIDRRRRSDAGRDSPGRGSMLTVDSMSRSSLCAGTTTSIGGASIGVGSAEAVEGSVGVHAAEQSQGEPRPREGHRSRQQGQHEGDGGHQRAVPAG